jgi:hypothetical protein
MYPDISGGEVMTLNKRAEVLFTDEEFEAIKRDAARQGVSFGEYVRDAVRRNRLQPSQEARDAAFERLMHGREIDVGSWEDAKKLIGRWVDKEP